MNSFKLSLVSRITVYGIYMSELWWYATFSGARVVCKIGCVL